MSPLLLLAGLTAALADAPSWEQLDATDAWEQVATKSSDYGEVSIRHKRFDKLDCLEGRLLTPGDPDVMLAVAADAESALQWSSADLAAAEVIEEKPVHVDYYQYLDVPNWTLVADRYWILRGTMMREGTTRRFRWTRVPDGVGEEARKDALARSSAAIEPPTNVGEWVFTQRNEGVDVRYRACADIGGAIPLWLQKLVAKSTLPDTVADLVRESRRRQEAP